MDKGYELYCLVDPEFYDSANGEPEAAIEDGDGGLVPDRRGATCQAPRLWRCRPASARR